MALVSLLVEYIFVVNSVVRKEDTFVTYNYMYVLLYCMLWKVGDIKMRTGNRL